MQKVIVIGRMGHSAKLNAAGTICNFSVAVGEKWTAKDGEKKEHTEWFNCSMFGKAAPIFEKYTEKGSQVCVEGRLRTREYEGKDGTMKKATDLIVTNFEFLSKKKEATSEAASEDDSELPF